MNTDNTANESGPSSISRRSLLKTVGASGIAFSGISGASAAPPGKTVQLLETGWRFDFELPSDFESAASTVAIDEVPYHGVDVTQDVLSVSPWATPGIVATFKSNDRVVFTDDYYGVTDAASPVPGIQHNGNYATTRLAPDTRRSAAFEFHEQPSLPDPEVTFDDHDVIVNSPDEQTVVQEGERVNLKFSEREYMVRERIPAVDQRNTNENDAPMFQQRSLKATPILQAQNYGELSLTINPRAGAGADNRGGSR